MQENMTAAQKFAIDWHFTTYPEDHTFDQILETFENQITDLLGKPLVECTPFYKESMQPNSLCLVVRDMANKLPALCTSTLTFFVDADVGGQS